MVYVIKDEDGNYVSPRKKDRKYYFVLFSGIVSGFSFYINADIANSKINKFNGLGNNFRLEYVDLKSIPRGKRVYTIGLDCLIADWDNPCRRRQDTKAQRELREYILWRWKEVMGLNTEEIEN